MVIAIKLVFISDIHSNLEALQEVMNKIQEIKPSEIFCLGDICGYGANPLETISIIKRIPCVMGNHEFAVTTGDVSWFNAFAAEAIEWTRKNITLEEMKFLSNLKHRLIVNIDGLNLYLVHGSPDDPLFTYIYEKDADVVKNLDCDVLVVGHTHIPFVKSVGKKIVINAGSVGQPRDGDPRSSFVVLDTETLEAEIVRVNYNVEEAAQKIIKAGLPKFLAERLYKGV
jgi:putative phosphoesterase